MSSNGTAPKTILGIPCGCDNRQVIMGAGEWKIDAAVIGAIALVIAGILVLKYTKPSVAK